MATLQSKFEPSDLSVDTIIYTLAEAQIANISPSDLNNPQPEFLIALYSNILRYIDSRQDDIEQVDFEALQQLENPEHHLESVRKMNLCHKIREVLAAVRCPIAFTLKDLLRPEAKRTGRFISALLNFCFFKDGKIDLIRPIMDECSLLEDQRVDLQVKISQLKEEIAQYHEAREAELSLVQEVESKVKELRQAIPSLNSQQISLRNKYRTMKEKAQEMDEMISSAEFSLVQSVQENANLHSRIVQSPEKLQRALEENKLLLVEAKNAERSAMQLFQEKAAMVQIYTKAHKKMSKHYSQVQALLEQMDSAKSIEKDVKTLKKKLSDDELLNKSLDAKLIERQGIVEKMDILRRQIEKESQIKCEEASKELDNVKKEAESRKHAIKRREENVARVLAEVEAVTSKIELVKETGASKQQQLLSKAEKIAQEFDQYMKSIDALLP